MTQADKIRLLRLEFKGLDEALLLDTLNTATAITYNRVYGYLPADEGVYVMSDLEDRVSVEVAKRILWKRGADGQTAHGENGINRTWADNASGFDDIFKSWGIIPRVGTPIKRVDVDETTQS